MEHEFEETIISREEIDESHFPFLAVMFSDENLAADFVLRQLINWKNDYNYELLFMMRNDFNLCVFLKERLQSLPSKITNKMKSLFYQEEKTNVSAVIDKIVCYRCRNYGSLISSRLCQSGPTRFLCEECEKFEKKSVQPISELIWSKRCNECSNYAANCSFNSVKSLRTELKEELKNFCYFIASMMTVCQDQNLKMVILKSLFTLEEQRHLSFGRRLIEIIPNVVDQSYMISICTSGLNSEILFGNQK